MSKADRIREYVLREIIDPARKAGEDEIEVFARSVHDALELENSFPNVCQVLAGERLWSQFSTTPPKIIGPDQSSTTSYLFRLSAPKASPRVFGTRFWGFSPEDEPFVSFTHQGTRDKIARTSPGDLIVVLGTKTENTAPEDRGRLLGLIEPSQTSVFTDDIISEVTKKKTNLFENGKFKWPYALTARKAWVFPAKPLIEDVIGRQLSMAAITDVDELDVDEATAVLALERVEVELPETIASVREQRLGTRSREAVSGKTPEYSFPPSKWSSVVAKSDGTTDVYLMQFGSFDVWKIGITQNIERRTKQLNFPVPVEHTKAKWELRMRHGYENGFLAYEMEQYLLNALSKFSTMNERVVCSRQKIEEVWISFLTGHSSSEIQFSP